MSSDENKQNIKSQKNYNEKKTILKNQNYYFKR